jgi:hypothetical protein
MKFTFPVTDALRRSDFPLNEGVFTLKAESLYVKKEFIQQHFFPLRPETDILSFVVKCEYNKVIGNPLE